MHYWVPGEEKCMARFTLVEGPSPVMDSGGGAQGFVMYCTAVFYFFKIVQVKADSQLIVTSSDK